MHIRFSVPSLPPKKDGANSMWRKPSEVPRLKELRRAAVEAMAGRAPLSQPLELKIVLYAHPDAGDLDTFITGICDGLMAVHQHTPIERELWDDIPEQARPDRVLAFGDDKAIYKIDAERRPPDAAGERYEVELRWSEKP